MAPRTKVALLKQPGFWFAGAQFGDGMASEAIYRALCGTSQNPHGERPRGNAQIKALELFELCVKHEATFDTFRHNLERAFKVVAAEWDSFCKLPPGDTKKIVMAYMKARKDYMGPQHWSDLTEAVDKFAIIWTRVNEQVQSDARLPEFELSQLLQTSLQISPPEAPVTSTARDKTCRSASNSLDRWITLDKLPDQDTPPSKIKLFLRLVRDTYCKPSTSGIAVWKQPIGFLDSYDRAATLKAKTASKSKSPGLATYGTVHQFLSGAQKGSAIALLTNRERDTGKVLLLRRLEPGQQGTQVVFFDSSKTAAAGQEMSKYSTKVLEKVKELFAAELTEVWWGGYQPGQFGESTDPVHVASRFLLNAVSDPYFLPASAGRDMTMQMKGFQKLA